MIAVPGLALYKDFFSTTLLDALLHQVDREQWSYDLKRRVQHYGFKYDYRKHACDPAAAVAGLPEWAQCLSAQMRQAGVVAGRFNQLIVNEYLSGQGIAMHRDSTLFGNEIASLSVGSSCVMTFAPMRGPGVTHVELDPGDLLVIRGDARYCWKHGIAARKKDIFEGRTIIRQRRISLTFRQLDSFSKYYSKTSASS